jgi:MFS family permease
LPVRDERQAVRPATFRDVFASGEFRALFTASLCSWVGDYLAKAAVTALVFHQTGSITASAATFAISFLPWLAGGPVLAAIAERYPQRTVMIVSDLARAVLIALVALPHLPIAAMLVLLFCTSLLNPPFEASRSAVLPRILPGERYVLALSVQNSAGQGAQLIGYFAGSAVAAFSPRLALLIDAGTFLFSAFLIGLRVHARPAALAREKRTHLLRETAAGFRVVFGTPTLRAIAILVLAASLFTVPPEGLAAAWAGQLESDPGRRGVAQGMIMAATPLGFFLGGLLISRLLPPATRQRLIRPFAILAPLALVPTLLRPNAVEVALLAALCGFFVAGMAPTSNGLFVQVLPHEFRARAFGIMQSGLQLVQGAGVLVTGALAARFALPTVVGTWSVLGVLLMLAVGTLWPSRSQFATAIEQAAAANDAAMDTAPGAPAPTRTKQSGVRPADVRPADARIPDDAEPDDAEIETTDTEIGQAGGAAARQLGTAR